MRKLVYGFLCLISLNVIGQDFGTVTQDEVNYKICPFDKDADAVIFFDRGVSTHNEDKELINTRRIKFKILKENGVRKGNLSIVYYSRDEFEKIEDLEAYVYNQDGSGVGQKTMVDRKSIYYEKINDYVSEIKIALPQVKIGSIIEYRYTSVMKSYSGLRDWYFQTDLPTLLSQYDLTILPGASFAYKAVKSHNLPIDFKHFKDDGRMIFEMKNVGGLRGEPYMDARGDYLQRIVFQLSEYQTYYGTRKKYANSWAELGRELSLDEDFGRATEKNVRGSDELMNQVKTKETEYEKMITIFSFIQKNFSWNGIYSKYSMEGLKNVWDKRSGTSGEINLLLLNLLKESKLDAQALLVSERDHGKVDASYPFVDQFNKVVALVSINGARYILDATDQNTPPGMIPFELLNTNAFVVSKKSTGVITLTDNSRSWKNFTGINSEIDEDGNIEGAASVFSYDYSRLDRVTDYRKKSTKEFTDNYFLRNVSNVEIDSINLTNIETDSLPLEQKFHFKANMPASGEYRIVNMNLFLGMEKSPFVSDNRFSDINFGSRVLENVTQNMLIPATMKPDVLPKNINLIMPDNSITFSRLIMYDSEKNQITCRVKYEVTRTVFVPEEYPAVKDFYKKMVELLNEPVVLKKK